MTESVIIPEVTRFRLWFAMFGGAGAWLVHLLSAALISEWACVANRGRSEFLGINAVAWLLLSISIATLLIAACTTWFNFRMDRSLRNVASESHCLDAYDQHGTDVFMARMSLWANALFVLIILAQSVPILFYLTGC